MILLNDRIKLLFIDGDDVSFLDRLGHVDRILSWVVVASQVIEKFHLIEIIDDSRSPLVIVFLLVNFILREIHRIVLQVVDIQIILLVLGCLRCQQQVVFPHRRIQRFYSDLQLSKGLLLMINVPVLVLLIA
jgi:hypothetical protein